MSLAEIFDGSITITPGVDGSFIVFSGNCNTDKRGFTSMVDLLSFLERAEKARQPVDVLEVAEPLVTRTVTSDVKAWPVHDGDTKRTSAYGSLADRIASTGDKPAA